MAFTFQKYGFIEYVGYRDESRQNTHLLKGLSTCVFCFRSNLSLRGLLLRKLLIELRDTFVHIIFAFLTRIRHILSLNKHFFRR